jgi:flagellar basal-body rod modification protein FlgD
MATIPGIRTYDPAAKPGAAGTDVQSVNDLSQNFLRMLTVQLQNQDPMNPMDNAAMTAQLAQLNMVDGINKLNTSVNAMMAQLKASTQLSMADSVGRSVLSEGNQMYFAGQAMSFAAGLSSSANQLTAVLRDAQGQEVDRMDLGAVKAGVTDFVWDGTDAQGNPVSQGRLALEFMATNQQGDALDVRSYVSSMVSKIGMEDGVMKLGLLDGRSIAADDIFKWVAV